MMSQGSKRELLATIRPRYRKASKKEKQKILDEFVAVTGYHRKYAIRLMNSEEYKKRRKKPGPRRIYQGEVVTALEYIWEICGQICSRRLQPFLPEIVKVLERNHEIHISGETKRLLLQMSRSSIDRCLSSTHRAHPHGLSTTRPGTLLKKSIPVQTYTPWDEEKPGFMEIDLAWISLPVGRIARPFFPVTVTLSCKPFKPCKLASPLLFLDSIPITAVNS